jgi:hypothetical protein
MIVGRTLGLAALLLLRGKCAMGADPGASALPGTDEWSRGSLESLRTAVSKGDLGWLGRVVESVQRSCPDGPGADAAVLSALEDALKCAARKGNGSMAQLLAKRMQGMRGIDWANSNAAIERALTSASVWAVKDGDLESAKRVIETMPQRCSSSQNVVISSVLGLVASSATGWNLKMLEYLVARIERTSPVINIVILCALEKVLATWSPGDDAAGVNLLVESIQRISPTDSSECISRELKIALASLVRNGDLKRVVGLIESPPRVLSEYAITADDLRRMRRQAAQEGKVEVMKYLIESPSLWSLCAVTAPELRDM